MQHVFCHREKAQEREREVGGGGFLSDESRSLRGNVFRIPAYSNMATSARCSCYCGFWHNGADI